VPARARDPTSHQLGRRRDSSSRAGQGSACTNLRPNVDHDGCDTHNEILARDLTDVMSRPGTRAWVVHAGTLADPYTGSMTGFVRAQDTSSAVQIDHVLLREQPTQCPPWLFRVVAGDRDAGAEAPSSGCALCSDFTRTKAVNSRQGSESRKR
jgi:hypothetical protein